MGETFGERREPVLLATGPIEDASANLTFMRDARARARKAGPVLWASAAAAFGALVAVTLLFALPDRSSGALITGTVIGALFWPLVVVAVSALFFDRGSQRGYVKVFLVACLVLTCLSSVSALALRGTWQRWLNKDNMSAEDFRQQASQCMRARDLGCQEANWRDYVRLRPDDGNGHANLGIALNRRDRHDEAVIQFGKALNLGEGTYDLFAFHADSLTKLGRTDEAIEWSYKALSVVPELVDVRGKLAKLLVAVGRPYEALALLQSFDRQREVRGMAPQFAAQHIAIETALDRSAPPSAAERMALRLPTYAGHYFAPVTLGTAKTAAFLVDTGATRMSLSEAMLRASNVKFRVTDPKVWMHTADGRKVQAQAVTIESIRVGGFELSNVPAVVYSECAPLLGQSVLSQFDLRSSRVQGVEFLTLIRRAA